MFFISFAQREIGFLAELDHPRIMKIFELICDEDAELVYLITECVSM